MFSFPSRSLSMASRSRCSVDRPDPHFPVKQWQERDPDLDFLRRADFDAILAGVHIRQRDVQARKEADGEFASHPDFHLQRLRGHRFQTWLCVLPKDVRRDRRHQDDESGEDAGEHQDEFR